MEGKSIVLLRTSSVARVPVYRHLRDCGLTLILVHPTQPVAAFDGLFSHHLLHDTHDVDALQPALQHFLTASELHPRAIISFDEYAVYPAAVLAERFGFRPIPLPPEPLRATCVKSAFRAFCARHGISAPRAVVLTPPPNGVSLLAHAEALLRAAGLSFPVVLKPCPGAGSLLVRLCQSPAEVRDHLRVMWHVLASHADRRHLASVAGGVAVLAEEYVGGQEVDMDCCVEDGALVFCAISDNFAVRAPFFVEEGGLCPSALPEAPRRALVRLLEQFLAAHGPLVHGVLHFEAKYDAARGRAYVIEVNCRLGSAETNTMVRTCYRGVELGESLVRCALGLPVRAQLRRHYPNPTQTPRAERGFFPHTCYCASVNVYPSREGLLTRVEVPEGDKALIAHSVAASPGDMVAPPPKVFYLLAWMVTRGESAAEAISAIQRVTGDFVQEIAAAQ